MPGLELDDAVLHAAGHSLALAFDKVGEWHPCCHSSPTIDCQVRTCRFGWRVRYGTGQQAAYLMPMDGPRAAFIVAAGTLKPTSADTAAAATALGNNKDDFCMASPGS